MGDEMNEYRKTDVKESSCKNTQQRKYEFERIEECFFFARACRNAQRDKEHDKKTQFTKLSRKKVGQCSAMKPYRFGKSRLTFDSETCFNSHLPP